MARYILTLILIFGSLAGFAQEDPLPALSAKNINNKIIISWLNRYAKPVTTLNIQRSYDSLKNYSTIGSVLSPQSIENGYVDPNPPYNKMYYRVFIAFEGGSYIITPPVRPVKDISQEPEQEKFPWIAEVRDSLPGIPFKFQSNTIIKVPIFKDTALFPAKIPITYPSFRIFTARDNNIVIHLQDAPFKKYLVKFFDENEKFLFQLTKLREEYLIIEKVNFVRPGWFRFEIFENGELIENNRFQIVKDPKKL